MSEGVRRELLVENVARALAGVDAAHEVYHQRPYAEWAQVAVDLVESEIRGSIADLARHHANSQRGAQGFAESWGWEGASAAARVAADTLESFAGLLVPTPPHGKD